MCGITSKPLSAHIQGMTTQRKRDPRGTTTGGQFATETKGEVGVSLGATSAPTPPFEGFIGASMHGEYAIVEYTSKTLGGNGTTAASLRYSAGEWDDEWSNADGDPIDEATQDALNALIEPIKKSYDKASQSVPPVAGSLDVELGEGFTATSYSFDDEYATVVVERDGETTSVDLRYSADEWDDEFDGDEEDDPEGSEAFYEILDNKEILPRIAREREEREDKISQIVSQEFAV